MNGCCTADVDFQVVLGSNRSTIVDQQYHLRESNFVKQLYALVLTALLAMLCGLPKFVIAQTLEAELQQIPIQQLVRDVRQSGDALRGAVVFHQPSMACSKCHLAGSKADGQLGPDLSQLDKQTSDQSLIESVLWPSKVIRKGFESVTLQQADGTTLTGLLVEQTDDKVVVRDVTKGGEPLTIAKSDIEQMKVNELSIMPAGQINQLNSRQQFLDLMRYLLEIRDGGQKRAQELQPSAALLVFKVPEYENHLDHSGLIKDLDDDAFARGEAIYKRVCANCHGNHDQPGSLPNSLRFAEGKFKNGSDPLSMYRTLTYGFGLMTPQSWMVPSQKYDVIHYIREAYLKSRNPTQYVTLDAAYLARLPLGDNRGPAPSKIEAWSAMDYGPTLAHTYEIPGQKENFAYKGIAVRLDPGAGGVARGAVWTIFDTDTLRTAAGWSARPADNFIDWKSIQFNGEHGIHPRIVGQTAFSNTPGPGWANPVNSQFTDDQRVIGRDGKRYGPLPREWGKYKGLYHHGQQAIFAYTIGKTEILESPRWQARDASHLPLMLRTFHVGPREQELVLQVAEHPDSSAAFMHGTLRSRVIVTPMQPVSSQTHQRKIAFDGETYLEIADAADFETNDRDFTVVARIKTREDGTIWSKSEGAKNWTPNGQAFFIRNGRLCFDIGWVGAVSGKSRVTNGKWHTVALTWQQSTGKARLIVDGKLDGEGVLKARKRLPKSILRVGFTAPDFPSQPHFRGEISELRFYQQQLTTGLENIEQIKLDDDVLVGRWQLDGITDDSVSDGSKHDHDARVHRASAEVMGPMLAGFAPADLSARWTYEQGKLRLHLPAGDEPLRFSIWHPTALDVHNQTAVGQLAMHELGSNPVIKDPDLDLSQLIAGGPARWPQILTTNLVPGADTGPFAVDILTAPESNPWLAQVRFTGLDFFADGRLAVCSWDGDVWIVSPSATTNDVATPANTELKWQRIASGLFQPLGLKIVNGKIHVTCRDQLTVLHDLNGDGETDFYECLNNDHQVTEHFHEFAMGLQTDDAGNFYYAKSGCHGKAAVVPHHGTLLKVSPDGSRTEILANGFRAANGVCLNPDGSFFVTDQEGFWNPKNRINWVTLAEHGQPKFYGNMLGYHDVTDSSDAAMEQPLCWITNEFDRSPAELLWVDSQRWGPLNGSLLNLSYGYGKVFLVPHEKVGTKMQGGMVELPVPAFPTGVMRGRFHPTDGQLVMCGMFAWAGNATQPGGLYRLRATGKPVCLPVELKAMKSGLQLTFTEALDPKSVDAKQFSIRTWSLKRTANYGSKHYDEQSLRVREAKLSNDGKTLLLDIEGLSPTWCMEIKYSLKTQAGAPAQATIHNTIHELK